MKNFVLIICIIIEVDFTCVKQMQYCWKNFERIYCYYLFYVGGFFITYVSVCWLNYVYYRCADGYNCVEVLLYC